MTTKQFLRTAAVAIMLFTMPQNAEAQNWYEIWAVEGDMKIKIYQKSNPMPTTLMEYTGKSRTFVIPETFQKYHKFGITQPGITYDLYIREIEDLGYHLLDKLVIPSTVTSINAKALIKAHVDVVEMPKANSRYKVENGALIDMQSNELVWCSRNVSGTFVIPSDIKTIGECAFDGCTKLTSVVIPNSVSSIGSGAFANCRALTSITIPNSVTSIGSGAFSSCENIRTLTLPNSVKTLEDYSFAWCSRLEKIVIPNSVTTIGNNTFYSCKSLSSIIVPNSVVSIGARTFESCAMLASATIPATLSDKAKGLAIFASTPKLRNVTLRNANGTKKFSNAWYWFKKEDPNAPKQAVTSTSPSTSYSGSQQIDPETVSIPSYNTTRDWYKDGSGSSSDYRKHIVFSDGTNAHLIKRYYNGRWYYRSSLAAGEYKTEYDAAAAGWVREKYNKYRNTGAY